MEEETTQETTVAVPATVKIELGIEEANLILNALQELPHKVVHGLIQKILEQANSQITPQ